MNFDILIPDVARSGSRTKKLWTALGYSVLAATNAFCAEHYLSRGGVGPTLVSIAPAAATITTTFATTYSLLSAMEPDMAPPISE